MRDLRKNEVIPDDKVWFCDGFIYVISRKISKIKGHEIHATKNNGEEYWELTGTTMGFA